MKPSALLCADIHIRPDKPKSRIDNFQEAMWHKWDFILNLANKNNVPILVAGDLGHKSEWPNWLLEKFIAYSNIYDHPYIYVVPGQHDMPNHNIQLMNKSALGVLRASEILQYLINNEYADNFGLNIYSFPYNTDIQKPDLVKDNQPNIAIAHQMVIEGNVGDWKGQNFNSGKDLLKRFPEYDLILTGDNHIPFTIEYEGRLLVNPGSMMRTTAAQIGHEPRVYLWYAETNKVEICYLPFEKGVISKDHIEKAKEKEEKDIRVEAFIKSIKVGEELNLKFEDNMEHYLQEHPVSDAIWDKIWISIEGDTNAKA